MIPSPWTWFFTFGFCCWISGHAIGQTLRTSPVDTKLLLGDEITLNVEGVAPENVTWTILGQTVCQGAACKLSTKRLGIGTFTVTAQIEAEPDRYRLPFYLRIEQPTDENYRLPQKLSPATVDRDVATHVVNPALVLTKALAGRGFLYLEKTSRPIDGFLTPIKGLARVKTRPESLVQVNSPKIEARVLPSGILQVNPDSGAFMALLGTISMRNLSDQPLSVFVQDILEVHLQPRSMVIVNCPAKSLSVIGVTAVQGTAQVGYLTEGRAEQAILVAGQRLKYGATQFEMTTPNPSSVAASLLRTYPELDPDETYFPGSVGPAESRDQEILGEMTVLQDKDLWLEAALKAQSLAGESLGVKDLLQLVVVFFRLNLFETAKDLLSQVLVFDADNDQALYYLGLMALLEQDYSVAASLLGKADPWNDGVTQRQGYYAGIAHLGLDQPYRAEGQFRYSRWQPISAKLDDEAAVYLKRLEQDTWFDFMVRAGYGYDTNARGINPDSSSPLSGHYTDQYGELALELKTWLYRLDQGQVWLPMRLDSRNFLQPAMAELSSAKLQVPLKFLYHYGEDSDTEGPKADNTAKVAIGGGTNLIAHNWGGNSVGYEFVGEGTLGAPRWWGLYLGYSLAYVLDRQPEEEAGYDPWLGEVTGLVHQSHRRSIASLGVKPQLSKTWRLESGLHFESRNHTNAAAKAIDATDLSLRLGVDGALGRRFLLQGEVFYRMTTLPDFLPQSRDDGRYGFETLLDFYLWSHFTTYLQLGYQSRSSNIEAYTYSRLEVEGGVSFEY